MSHTASYLRAGRGRSGNAEIAEENGLRPLSRAIPVTARRLRAAGFLLTQADVRLVFVYRGSDEWHHVGKYASECDYYQCPEDPEDLAAFATDLTDAREYV